MTKIRLPKCDDWIVSRLASAIIMDADEDTIEEWLEQDAAEPVLEKRKADIYREWYGPVEHFNAQLMLTGQKLSDESIRDAFDKTLQILPKLTAIELGKILVTCGLQAGVRAFPHEYHHHVESGSDLEWGVGEQDRFLDYCTIDPYMDGCENYLAVIQQRQDALWVAWHANMPDSFNKPSAWPDRQDYSRTRNVRFRQRRMMRDMWNKLQPAG